MTRRPVCSFCGQTARGGWGRCQAPPALPTPRRSRQYFLLFFIYFLPASPWRRPSAAGTSACAPRCPGRPPPSCWSPAGGSTRWLRPPQPNPIPLPLPAPDPAPRYIGRGRSLEAVLRLRVPRRAHGRGRHRRLPEGAAPHPPRRVAAARGELGDGVLPAARAARSLVGRTTTPRSLRGGGDGPAR